MVISKDNIRIIITLPKELDKKISELADSENRSKNNMIVTILKRYFETKQD